MTNADYLDDRRYVRAIAILRDEPEAVSCAHAIENSVVRRVSAANFVEAAVFIDASRDPVANRRFDDLIKEAQIIIEPVTEPQARIAREAYRRSVPNVEPAPPSCCRLATAKPCSSISTRSQPKSPSERTPLSSSGWLALRQSPSGSKQHLTRAAAAART